MPKTVKKYLTFLELPSKTKLEPTDEYQVRMDPAALRLGVPQPEWAPVTQKMVGKSIWCLPAMIRFRRFVPE
jgi:hypothetical protein